MRAHTSLAIDHRFVMNAARVESSSANPSSPPAGCPAALDVMGSSESQGHRIAISGAPSDHGFLLRLAQRILRSTDFHVGCVVAGTSTLLAATFLQLWTHSLSLPPTYQGDGTFYNLLAKGIQENGSYITNPRLGFPFRLEFLDYPLGADNLNLLFIRIISWFTPNFAVTANLWILFTFPLVAVCAYIVLRRLKANPLPSAVAAILYTFIQYHFRGGGWLLLIGYYALPFGILLAIRVLQGDALFARTSGVHGAGALLSRRNVATLATILVIGSTGLYLAAFTVALLVVAVLAQVVLRRNRVALAGCAGLLAILLMVGLNTTPSLLKRASEGTNQAVPIRAAFESEVYGLTLTRMVMPPRFHRFGPARRFGEHFSATTALKGTGEDAGYIGAVGLTGLAGLGAILLGGLTGGVSADIRRRYGPLVICAVTAFAFGTVGGVNTLFSYLVSPVLRGLGRISSVLAFCGLAAVALGLDACRERLRSRGHRLATSTFLIACAAVAVLGLYDQSGNPFTTGYYTDLETRWNADARFVKQVEAIVPHGAAIYTLPEQPFPENAGPGGLSDYDSAYGYLHSSHLRWSYGAMRGREGRWLDDMSGYDVEHKVRILSTCGFDGIWLDRLGYSKPDEVAAELARRTETAGISSEDGRRTFYSLGAVKTRHLAMLSSAERDAFCSATFRPIYFTPARGVGPKESDGVGFSRWLAASTEITVHNYLDAGRAMQFRVTVHNQSPGPLTVRLDGPGDSIATTVVPYDAEQVLALDAKLPHGRSGVSLRATSAYRIVDESRVLRATNFQFSADQPPQS